MALISRGPLTLFLLIMLVGYTILAVVTDAKDLIVVGSALMVAMSIAICVAYFKPAWRALSVKPMTPAAMLALGIFLSWAGSAMLRTMSIIIYGLHRPDLLGTDFQTFGLYLSFLAGLLHLAAPDLSEEGLLPPRSWVAGGIIAGGGVSIVLAITLLRTMR